MIVVNKRGAEVITQMQDLVLKAYGIKVKEFISIVDNEMLYSDDIEEKLFPKEVSNDKVELKKIK